MTRNEDPQKRAERESIVGDAQQTAETYRQMARLNSIANTPADVRDAWLQRVSVLEGRRDHYRDTWGVDLPHHRVFKGTSQVSPEWLHEMVDALEIIVWQLDHEF